MFVEHNRYSPKEINWIPIKKIKPLYIPHITKTFYKRMNINFHYLDTFDLLLPVEKHPQKEEYFLVGRYDCYLFMINETNLKEVPCIIEEFTGKPSQYLKILRRLHNKGDSNKTSKQSLLNKLQARNLSISQVIKMTGFTKQDLEDYHYKQTVPQEYINNHTTEKTLNWIDNLSLDNTVKDFLYKSAGLPQSNKERLTDEKRKFLQYFFKHAKRFEQLTIPEQIEVLATALNFRSVVMSFLQEKIYRYLD
ncbi:hypothetical protein IOC57_17640 [Bacillus sp. SD075]|uniref:hypothetical protein n=1 Tax=Bacillus sp. SD075 TaxID=2781732 RepID=UPI001A97A229|nr:hypothetical protein [Bacillus sp. SD075]MBO0999557.1 hypothetical protein [Bacillus sp. SD075]